MIVPDTSAWIEYLRGTGSPVHLTLQHLVDTRADLAVTGCVVMEVLAGGGSQKDVTELESLMMTYPVLPMRGIADFEEASALYRACRVGGETIRKLTDCLVAVPVIREGAELLHHDADFDAIARHSELRIYPLE